MGNPNIHKRVALGLTLFLSYLCIAQATLPYVPVPFYGPSANGFTSQPRGFNTFGLQAASDTLKQGAGWDFNDYHFRQQCSQIPVSPSADYVCSIDSGWSQGCNGDENGIFAPDTNVIPDIKYLADYLDGKGLKLGLYILPGAFSGDADKIVEGTDGITLGSLFDDIEPEYNCRKEFVYGKDGVQQFHDSVIKKFVEWGVDFIKLDYMTPGSPSAGEVLPSNSSGAAIAYHNAIASSGAKMRLDISWKLDRSDPYWGIWRATSDSLRVDQDINNSNESTFVAWKTVLRALEFYRQFITEQLVASRNNVPIMVRPDLDNTYIGNAASISGLSDVQRYTQAIHWIGAGANLLTGSDLTRLDSLGRELLWNEEAMGVAGFTAKYPMQPRMNGGVGAQQLQAWVAGPSDGGMAVVVLANYGPESFGESVEGTQTVGIALEDLGLTESWAVRRVWGGGGAGGGDHVDLGVASDKLQSDLGPGESVLYVLTRQ